MARTVNQIFSQIVSAYVSAMAAINVTINPATWSRRNKQQLAMNTFAAATATFEQIYDAYTADIENDIAAAAPQTPQWFQNFILNIFQYSAAIPQILQFNTTTFAPYYPTPNTVYNIVSQCVVVPGAFGTTTIKVATGSGPAMALSGLQLAALQSTINVLSVPGVNINVQSNNADKIYISGKVTYNGSYSGLIPVPGGTVTQAIKAYLASIPTSGVVSVGSTVGLMKLTDLIAAVRAVPGVIDFELYAVNARPDGTAFVPGSNNMVNNSGGSYTWLMPEWNSGLSGGGYMVTETTTGYDIDSALAPFYTPQ